MYDGVIFDKDGVLLDSGLNNFQWLDRARVNHAREHGVDFSIDEAKVVAKGSKEDVLDLLDEKGISFEKLMGIEEGVERTKIRMIRNGYIRLFPGARKILSNVEVAGLATNSPSLSTSFEVDFFGLDGFFDCVRSTRLEEGRLFERRKPDSVMLEEVIDELGLDNPVMVGDTSSDVYAAENAGIDSILVESYRDGNGLDSTHRVKSVDEALKFLR
jgi:phosphoglycolate phosphatase-like HAD superfamily hydrolase